MHCVGRYYVSTPDILGAAALPPFRFFCWNPLTMIGLSVDQISWPVPFHCLPSRRLWHVFRYPLHLWRRQLSGDMESQDVSILMIIFLMMNVEVLLLNVFNSSRLFVDLLYVLFLFVCNPSVKKTGLTGEYHPCHVVLGCNCIWCVRWYRWPHHSHA